MKGLCFIFVCIALTGIQKFQENGKRKRSKGKKEQKGTHKDPEGKESGKSCQKGGKKQVVLQDFTVNPSFGIPSGKAFSCPR